MDHIRTQLLEFRDLIVAAKTRQDGLQKQLSALEKEQKDLKQQEQTLRAALDLLEKSNIVSREHIKVEIEKLVTQGLRAILENPDIVFNINFVTKRNRTEAEFCIYKENTEQITGDILYNNGGGLVDIISIALRIIIMQLLQIKGPLILDEPGKNISAQYVNNFGSFLTQTAKTFDRQIIMITHNEKLAAFAEKTFKVEQTDGISKVFIIE